MAEEQGRRRKREKKNKKNQENRKQGEGRRGKEREERGKILRRIIWCFILILILCNKLKCQLWSGWQKT
jgi:hypothetical protein